MIGFLRAFTNSTSVAFSKYENYRLAMTEAEECTPHETDSNDLITENHVMSDADRRRKRREED